MTQIGNVTSKPVETAITETQLKEGTKLNDLQGNKNLIIQFAEADTNGDGVLSKEESYIFNNTEVVTREGQKGEKVYPGMSIDRTKASETLKAMDADEDGKISENEIKLFKKTTKFACDADKKFMNSTENKLLLGGSLAGMVVAFGGATAAMFSLMAVPIAIVGVAGFCVCVLASPKIKDSYIKKATRQNAEKECADLITPQTKIKTVLKPGFINPEAVSYTFKKYADALAAKN